MAAAAGWRRGSGGRSAHRSAACPQCKELGEHLLENHLYQGLLAAKSTQAQNTYALAIQKLLEWFTAVPHGGSGALDE